MRKILLGLLFALPLAAQVTMTQTTLSAALSATGTQLSVASATGITAPGSPGGAIQTLLFVDREAMPVVGITGLRVTVQRGSQGTQAAAHASAAVVYAGTPAQYAQADPTGACTSTALPVLPLVVIPTGNVWTCSGGSWAILAGTAAPAGAHYLVTRAETGLVNAFNVGGLTTGPLLITVSAGVATPSTSTTTGTGAIVMATSPTLITPALGVATATTINKVTLTAPTTAATLTLVQGSSLITAGAFALTLTSTAASNATIPAGTTTLMSTATVIALAQTPLTTLGDIEYVNSTPALARLAGQITTAKQYLSQTGTGAVSAAPAWATIAAADLSNGVTGSGAVVLANTPTLITPNIGVATGTSLIATGVLTAGAGSAIGWTGRSLMTSTADGFMNFTRNNGAGAGNFTLILGPAAGDTSTPALLGLYQANPQLFLRDAGGGGTANLMIEAQKSTTGERFVCITTAGQLVSRAAACVGT